MFWLTIIVLLLLLILDLNAESICFSHLNSILPSQCSQKIKEDFTEIRENINNDPTFEEVCSQFIEGISSIDKEYTQNTVCDYFLKVDSVIFELTKRNDPYNVVYVANLIETVKLLIKHGFSNQLKDFLEFVVFRPERFKFFYLELDKMMDTIKNNPVRYLRFILNTANTIGLLLNRNADGFEAVIVDFVKLATKNIKIGNKLVSGLIPILQTFEGGAERSLDLLKSVLKFVKASSTRYSEENFEFMLDDVLNGVLEVVRCYYENACRGDLLEKVNAYLTFISQLLFYKYDNVLYNFIDLIQRFCCRF